MIKMIVTGTIGSGKSSVVNCFKRHLPANTHFVSADEYVDELYYDEDVQDKLLAAFGTFNKSQIRNIVFNDTDKLQQLTDLFVPYFAMELVRIAAYNGNVVIELPVFFETKLQLQEPVFKALRNNFCVVTVAMKDEAVRVQRIIDRCKVHHPDWTDADVDKIISAQLPSWIKELLADVVIFNDGSEADLDAMVKSLTTQISFSKSLDTKFRSEDMGCTSSILPDDIFRVVSGMYSERHRQYHNLSHISDMVDKLKSLKGTKYEKYIDSIEMHLAILFHDIIYNPKANDNEEQSVKFLFKVMPMLVPEIMAECPEVLERVAFMIMCTKKHVIPESPDCQEMFDEYEELEEMTKVFLDLDLSVFLGKMSQLRLYEDGIREEYNFIADKEYYPARLSILKSFMNRPRIFLSDAFENADERARKNLYSLYVEVSRKDPS